MAESAACPGFQLGRPRYNQVSLLVLRCLVDIFKAFGAENSSILRPALRMLLLHRKVALIRALFVLLQIWTNFSLFTIGSAIVWTFWFYASWHVVCHQRCGTKRQVTVMLDCKLHFNHKLLNMLFTLHFSALAINLNVFCFFVLNNKVKWRAIASEWNQANRGVLFFLGQNETKASFRFFQKESGTCLAQDASCRVWLRWMSRSSLTETNHSISRPWIWIYSSLERWPSHLLGWCINFELQLQSVCHWSPGGIG